MTDIEIPFNAWSVDRIKAGRKWATTRRTRKGKPGDRFLVEGELYELVEVHPVTLADVARLHYMREGCESPEEFIEVWKGIHPRAGWRPDQRVFIHLFQKVV